MADNTVNAENSEVKFYSQDEVNNMLIKTFAKLSRRQIEDANNNRSASTLNFQKFTKEKIIQYLENPSRNSNNLLQASIYFYNNSSHYQRLIDNYALMPKWDYTVLPLKYDIDKTKPEKLKKDYIKTCHTLENMNIRHEMQKVAKIAFREDVFFGVTWETNDSFVIQRIDPKLCKLTYEEDGVFNFSVDMSGIKETDLDFYPPQFTKMYNNYRNGQGKYQEVPIEISACFKVNQELSYILPPFSGCFTALHDIEDYKALVKQRTEVGNYKLINMRVPTDSSGNPTLTFNDVKDYYNLLLECVPDGIGVSLSLNALDVVNFDKSGNLADANEVNKSVSQFWSTSGTSELLFGGGGKATSTGIKLSTKSDSALVSGFIRQVERWINRRLKTLSGSTKFKVKILDTTIYNDEDILKNYKEASTLGVPGSKSLYFAALGLSPLDIASMSTIENDVLKIPDICIPLQSTYTQSSNENVGRPTNESKNLDLTDSGEQTIEDDSNANR